MKLIHKIFKHYLLHNKKYIYLFTLITVIFLLIFLYFNILFYHQMEGSNPSISRECYQNDILMRLVLVVACSFLLILFAGLYIDESGIFGHSGALVFVLVTGLIAVNLYTLFFPFIQSYRESMIIQPSSQASPPETPDDISVVTTETMETAEISEVPVRKRKKPLKPSIKVPSTTEKSEDMSDLRPAAQKSDEKSVDEKSVDEKSIDEKSIDEKSVDEKSIDEKSVGMSDQGSAAQDPAKASYDFLDIDD